MFFYDFDRQKVDQEVIRGQKTLYIRFQRKKSYKVVYFDFWISNIFFTFFPAILFFLTDSRMRNRRKSKLSKSTSPRWHLHTYQIWWHSKKNWLSYGWPTVWGTLAPHPLPLEKNHFNLYCKHFKDFQIIYVESFMNKSTEVFEKL